MKFQATATKAPEAAFIRAIEAGVSIGRASHVAGILRATASHTP